MGRQGYELANFLSAATVRYHDSFDGGYLEFLDETLPVLT